MTGSNRTPDYHEIARRAEARGLSVFGAFHPTAGDHSPENTGTLVLLGPREPGFWDHVTATPEFGDGQPDPLDRWSERVIGALADEIGAEALYPFGGPPHRPFVSWALTSGRAWESPIGLLVHDTAGLFVSYRGALAIGRRLALPPAPSSPPCRGCAAPCKSACPVGAFHGGAYDVAACHAYLDTPAGAECLDRGCKARAACPVSQAHGRAPQQSAHHMSHFHARE